MGAGLRARLSAWLYNDSRHALRRAPSLCTCTPAAEPYGPGRLSFEGQTAQLLRDVQ